MNITLTNKFNAILIGSLIGLCIPNPAGVGASDSLEEQSLKMNQDIGYIQSMIYKVGFKNKEKGAVIAKLIYREARFKKIDPKIVVGIIRVESTFEQSAVSDTGDFSIAQINLNIWQEEFERMGREPLDAKRLKRDTHYAISRMMEILEILNSRHKNKKDWFAYYHSRSKKPKAIYFHKVSVMMAKM